MYFRVFPINIPFNYIFLAGISHDLPEAKHLESYYNPHDIPSFIPTVSLYCWSTPQLYPIVDG